MHTQWGRVLVAPYINDKYMPQTTKGSVRETVRSKMVWSLEVYGGGTPECPLPLKKKTCSLVPRKRKNQHSIIILEIRTYIIRYVRTVYEQYDETRKKVKTNR